VSVEHRPDADLAGAYRSARYRLEFPGCECERRIGVIDRDADARLREAGCEARWFIITACNPDSQRLDDATNDRRQQELRRDIEARHWRFVASHASADDGRWPEPGFCVFDADAREIRKLAQLYGQRALVTGEIGGAPALVWI